MKKAPRNKWIKATSVRIRTVNGQPVIDIRPPAKKTAKKKNAGMFSKRKSKKLSKAELGSRYESSAYGARWIKSLPKKKKAARRTSNPTGRRR